MRFAAFRTRVNAWVHRYRLELFLFVFALFVRLLCIGIVPPSELSSYWLGSDGKDYVNIAENVLTGNGFSRATEAPYIPDASRTPLYSLFLAVSHMLFGDFFTVLFVEALLSSLLPVLFVRIAEFFVRSRRVLLASGLLVALEPHLLFNTIFYASESLSILLLSWGVYELLKMVKSGDRRQHAILAGIALGLSTLARPIPIYLPVFLLPLFLYQGYVTGHLRAYLKTFGLFLLVFIVALSPWLIRNIAIFGDTGMSTNGWFNMYTRFAVTVVAIDTGSDFYTTFEKMLDELSVRGYVHHPPPVSELEIRDPRFAAAFRTETLRVMREHPTATLKLLLTAPLSVLTQDNTLGYLSSIHPFTYARPDFSPTLYASQHGIIALAEAVAPYLVGPYIVPYLMRAFFTLLFILSGVGAWILWRRRERFSALLLLGLIGYIVLFSINSAAQISGRYHAQFLIPEVVLAAVAVEALLRRLMGENTQKLWLIVRYGISGMFGAFVQTFFLYVWVSRWGFQSTYLVGAFIGFLLALVVTFLLQKFWTFRDHTTHRAREQVFWYTIVALTNVVMNIALLALVKEIFALLHHEFFHGWYLIAQIIIVVFTSGISFVLNYFFTFRHSRAPATKALESSPLV